MEEMDYDAVLTAVESNLSWKEEATLILERFSAMKAADSGTFESLCEDIDMIINDSDE